MKRNAGLLLTVILVMAMNVFGIHADVNYSDVSENFWAMPYIQKMADLKIITGYANGKYGPDDNVNKYVAVLVTYRTLDSQGLIAENEKVVLKNRYQAAIGKYNVPNWPNLHEAVGFFIENDIIKPEELENFQKNGKQVDISRQDMSLYLGKALNIYFKDNINDIIIPKFKDHGDIEFTALKYVNILNNHNIISGNEQGYFLPKSNLTRAQLAKMLSVGVDELQKVKAVEEKKIDAVVQVKLDDTKHIVFYDSNSNTKSYREKIDDELEITIDGKKATYEDLKLEMKVTLIYKNDKLVAITNSQDAGTSNTGANGNSAQTGNQTGSDATGDTKFTDTKTPTQTLQNSGVVNGTASADNKRYLYIKMDKTQEVKFYELLGDLSITTHGQKAKFEDIQKDDLIEFNLKDGFISEIIFRKPSRIVEGVLQSITIEEAPKLMIRIDDETKSFAISKEVSIEKNGVKKTLSDLSSGDKLKIELKNEEITSIVATAEENKEVGYIEKVVLGNPNQLVVKDVNGRINTYKVKTSAPVFIDNKAKSLYDLRVNYAVSLVLDSQEVSEIRASINVEKNFVAGKIVNKYDDIKVLIIESAGNHYTVNIKDNTLFLDAKGAKTSFEKMQIGSIVFSYGVVQEKIMSSEKVFMLE